MAKAVHVGVAGKARRSRKVYFGVGGKARKVKKSYVGVGGKARLFFSSGAAAGLYVVASLAQGPNAENLRCYRIDPSNMTVLGSVEIAQVGNNIISPATVGTDGKLLIKTTAKGENNFNSVDPLTGVILETVTLDTAPLEAMIEGTIVHPGMGGNRNVFYYGVSRGQLGMDGVVYAPSSYAVVKTFRRVTFPNSSFMSQPTGGGAPDTMFAIGCVQDDDGDNDYYTAELDVNTMAYRRQVVAFHYPCTIDVFGGSIFFGDTNRHYYYKRDYHTLATQASVDWSTTIPTQWGRNIAVVK